MLSNIGDYRLLIFLIQIYGVPACFAVNHTDTIYHGTIQYKTVFKGVSYLKIKATLALITEASPLLHKLSNIILKTFYDFAVVFYQHVNRVAEGLQRLDVVFDCYFSNSLKLQTGMGQGAGGTRLLRVSNVIPFPHNFLNSFLFNSLDKNDIGLYLAKKLVSIHAEFGNTFNVFFKMVTPSSKWYDLVHVINPIGIDICKARYYSSTVLLTPIQILMGRESVHFLTPG